LHAIGEPKLWLTGGALVVCIFMIVGLLALIVIQGARTFWPGPVIEIKTWEGTTLMGEVARSESYRPTEENIDALPEDARARAREALDRSDGTAERRLIRTENAEAHFTLVSDLDVKEESRPDWALVIERIPDRHEDGLVYAVPVAFLERKNAADDGPGQVKDVWDQIADEPEQVWQEYQAHHEAARDIWRRSERLKKDDLGAISRKENDARLEVASARLKYGADSEQERQAEEDYASVKEWAAAETKKVSAEIGRLDRENDRYKIRVRTADGKEQDLRLATIVRAYPANRLDLGQKLGVYLSRWKEFLTDDPRESNTAGGVFPAIWGTVTMTLLMCILVVPFGVLAALYLREYAKFRPAISSVRIAMNNLAGVPSIVFGVFGLGFFCLILGGGIDQLFFPAASQEAPVFGTGGMLWASLTLALLTLPVVIVTTEEALAAVPASLREGSYGCGASKWQTIWRIVLPRAMPGILTGAILAMARGAGEVAPLMLVGAVNAAPALPVDSVFPYVHAQRSFMHLGFQIYDVGFQSSNSEAGRPMVYTTTLLLITIVAALNLTAVLVRGHLRRRHAGGKFQ
jgi:phosphate transport system permease protein